VRVQNNSGVGVAGLSMEINAPDGLTCVSSQVLWKGDEDTTMAYYNSAYGLFCGTTSILAGITDKAWDVLSLTYRVDDDAAAGSYAIELNVLEIYDGYQNDFDYTASADAVQVKDHDHVASDQLVGVKAATYAEKGYTGDVVCSICGEVLTKGQVIPCLQLTLAVTADKTTVQPGDTITFTVALKNATSSGIAGLSFVVNAPEGLTYKSSSVRCGDQFATTNYNKSKGRFNGTGTEDIEGIMLDSWDVLTLTYTVDEDVQLGERTLTLGDILLYNGNLVDLPYTLSNASFTIEQHTHIAAANKANVKVATCTEKATPAMWSAPNAVRSWKRARSSPCFPTPGMRAW
jgi:uncharacterized repeat protein (TIGR01451 family)